MEAKEIQFTNAAFERIINDSERPEDIQPLREYQIAVNVAALQFLIEHCPELHGERRQEAERLYALADELRAQDPMLFDTIWSYPMVSVRWRDFLRRADENGVIAEVHYEQAILELGAIVASQVLLTDGAIEAELPLHGTRVMLPRLGAAVVDAATDSVVITKQQGKPATMHCALSDGAIKEVAIPTDYSQNGDSWLPLRAMELRYVARTDTSAVRTTSLIMDDLDPYRRCFGETAIMDRLDDKTFESWERTITLGWKELTSRCGGIFSAFLVEALDRGVDTLVPLKPNDKAMTTATAAIAVGALGFSEPPEPEQLAEGLIHEFEHTKIVALLDLLDLFEPPDPRAVHYSAWRDDPRPIVGQFHGLCASIKIRDFWDLWRRSVNALDKSSDAEFQYHCWQQRIERSFPAVQQYITPTADGIHFFASLEAKVLQHTQTRQPTHESRVSNSESGLLSQLADDKTLDHYLTWRSANCRIGEEWVRPFAAAYGEAGRARENHVLPEAEVVGGYEIRDYARQPHYELRYKRPSLLLDAISDDPQARIARLASSYPFRDLTKADGWLLYGDYATALDLYKTTIMQGQARPADWSGYLLSYRRVHDVGHDDPANHILDRPELVAPLYTQICLRRGAIDPRDLLRWLAV